MEFIDQITSAIDEECTVQQTSPFTYFVKIKQLKIHFVEIKNYNPSVFQNEIKNLKKKNEHFITVFEDYYKRSPKKIIKRLKYHFGKSNRIHGRETTITKITKPEAMEFLEKNHGNIPLKTKYNWGSNPFYYYAGLNSIHPTFVQEMMSDPGFDTDDIIYNLNNLSSVGGRKFSKELISLGKNYYRKINRGDWEPANLLKDRNVLVIGPGSSIIKYKKKIIKFIKKNRPIVFVLNAIDPIPKRYVHANIVCHTLRLLSDIDKYKKTNKFLITPFSSFSKNIKSRIKSKKILNFGLQVKGNRFKFEKNYAVLPNSLAITYTLGICTSGLCKKIFFAGLDGYNKNSPKKFEMDDVLQNYKSEKQARKIVSLTPTNYKIKMIKI